VIEERSRVIVTRCEGHRAHLVYARGTRPYCDRIQRSPSRAVPPVASRSERHRVRQRGEARQERSTFSDRIDGFSLETAHADGGDRALACLSTKAEAGPYTIASSPERDGRHLAPAKDGRINRSTRGDGGLARISRRDRGLGRAPTSERAVRSEAGSWAQRGVASPVGPRDPCPANNPCPCIRVYGRR
jgi:hypothetical protein